MGSLGGRFGIVRGGSLSGVEGDCCDFRALGVSVGVWSLSTAVQESVSVWFREHQSQFASKILVS